jgi:glycosyltransferase involved in cell wall biosynthesis
MDGQRTLSHTPILPTLKPFRIAFLLTQSLDSPSGLGRYGPMAYELARLGHIIHVVALHPDFHALRKTQFESGGVLIHYVAPMHVKKQGNIKTYYSGRTLIALAAQATWRLSQAALKLPVDILHIGKPHPMNSVAGLIGQFSRAKRLYLDCDDYESGSGNFTSKWQRNSISFFEKNIPKHVRAITTNTNFMQEQLVAWGVPKARIHYLSNGVNRSRFAPSHAEMLADLRMRLGLQNQRVVVYIGSLSLANHAVDLLLEAFSILQSMRPETRLLVVGGGEDYEQLKLLAERLRISPAVRFIGHVPAEKAPLYYRLGNVSIDPVRENDAARGRSPLKMFESWASGIPFVTSKVGDRELLSGSPPASLFAHPGNAESLAEKIENVLSDPNLAHRLIERGLERVEDFYWDRLVNQLLEVYSQTGTKNGQ